MKKTIILLVCTMILLMAFDSIVTTQNAYASEAASEVVGDSQTSSLPIDESLPYIELLPISSNKSSEISLKWNTCESDAVKRYEIYRSNHENDGYKLIAKVSDVNVGVFTDKNVNRNTKYFYRIRCCSDTCAGYFSVPVSGASSMEKTRGVSVRHINRSSLRISWSVSSEISVNGYQIYRSNTKNGKYVRIANISGRKRVSYTDKGLKTNKSYFYKVRGRSSVGYTPYSDIVSGSATRYLPIRAIRVRRVGSAAELSWNKSSEKAVMGYWIYRLNLQNGKYEKIATVRGRSSAKYTDRNVRNDSRYYYRVKGFTAKSSTPYSSIMFLPKSVYKKIDSFAVDRNTSTSASLKWAASKDIEVKGYDIYRSLSPCEGFKKTGTTYGINSNAYVDTNLDPHSKYYYKILGWTGTCHTPFSAVMETGMKEGFLTKQDLDALDLDGINKVMIVAHPDDETIFGGKHLLSDKYLVVCVTNRDTLRYGKRRAEEFKRAMDYCGAKCIILGYPDLKTGIIKNDWTNDITGINADVNLIINYKKWDTIVTHNKDGEYGHIHHKKISRVVYDNARNSGKSDLVQVFGPYYSKSNIPAINGTTTDFYPADKELLEKQNMMSSFYVSQKGAIANLCQMFDYEKFVSADSQY